MLSALLKQQGQAEAPRLPLLELPQELVERIVSRLGPGDQKAKKAARAVSARMRAAVNCNVTRVRVDSSMEGQSLPSSLLPQLQLVTIDVSNGDRCGLWSAANLARLGLENAPPACAVHVEADAAILHLRQLHASLAASGLLPRVRSLTQQSWGLQGAPASFGPDIEVHAKLKLVRVECIDALLHHTLRHDNLASLCFAPMRVEAWAPGLVRAVNRAAAATLRSLTVHFRPYQEIDLSPLAAASLPRLEHLELRAQNEAGFGPHALGPLASADLPRLKHLVVEMTGGGRVPHLGEFLRPLVRFEALETVELWATGIDSFAGLWGVGLGGVHLPRLRRLKLRVCPPPPLAPRAVFAACPADRVVDAFAGLTLDQLELHDIGLPGAAATAAGIKQLVLTNPEWEDVRVAMSPDFSPHLKVIRVCGSSARTVRRQMLASLTETPSPSEGGWRLGSPASSSAMARVRSFVVLHGLEAGAGADAAKPAA